MPKPKQKHKIFTGDEVRKMLDVSLEDMGRLMRLLKESGCRISEMLPTEPSDVEFVDGIALLHVDGKTGPRTVPIVECVQLLRDMVETTKAGRFFPMTYMTYHERLEEIKRKAGITKDVSFHGFRHFATSYYLRHGMPPHIVKKMFGWKQKSQQIDVYSHMYVDDVIQHVKRINEEQKARFLFDVYN